MGLLGKILSFFTGSLFSPVTNSLKTINTVNDIISSTKEGLEVLGVSEEQKAKTVEQTMKSVNDFHNSIAGENTERSRTRRVIALAFVVIYLTLVVGGVLVWRLDPAYSQHIFNVVASLNSLVTMIMVSYFGYYAVCNVVKSVKANKG